MLDAQATLAKTEIIYPKIVSHGCRLFVFYVKSIATFALKFFGYIFSVFASVSNACTFILYWPTKRLIDQFVKQTIVRPEVFRQLVNCAFFQRRLRPSFGL